MSVCGIYWYIDNAYENDYRKYVCEKRETSVFICWHTKGCIFHHQMLAIITYGIYGRALKERPSHVWETLYTQTRLHKHTHMHTLTQKLRQMSNNIFLCMTVWYGQFIYKTQTYIFAKNIYYIPQTVSEFPSTNFPQHSRRHDTTRYEIKARIGFSNAYSKSIFTSRFWFKPFFVMHKVTKKKQQLFLLLRPLGEKS